MKRLPAVNFNKKSLEFDKEDFIKFCIDYLYENEVYVCFEKDDFDNMGWGLQASLNNINYYIFLYNLTNEEISFKDLIKKYKEK